jgi:hypothetical protein
MGFLALCAGVPAAFYALGGAGASSMLLADFECAQHLCLCMDVYGHMSICTLYGHICAYQFLYVRQLQV